MKLVIVGGASAYTPDIVEGLLHHKDQFAGWELVLFDIDPKHLTVIERLCQRMVAAAGADVRVSATTDRGGALERARFVLNQPRAGGLRGRDLDERIALRHDVIGQETLGAGGISFAWRSIPLVLDIMADVHRLAPEAWVINYANPCGMVTEAVIRKYPDARFIGLCDMPTGLQWALGKLLRVDFHRIALDYAGLNHGGWSERVLLDGEDLLPRIRRWARWIPEFLIPPLREGGGTFRLFRRHGLLPDPYLRYYYFKDAMLERLKRRKRTRASEVMERLPLLYGHYETVSRQEVPRLTLHRGHTSHKDLAAQVIATMASGRKARFVIQQRNGGSVPDLPAAEQAQFPALIGPEGIVRTPVAALPATLSPLIRQIKASESLAVEAAMEGDRAKAVEAMEINPLVGERKTAERLVEAYLAAHRENLPQFHGPS